MTPTTIHGSPSSISFWPMILGSPPKRCIHQEWSSTTTLFRPCRSSSDRNVLPSAAVARRNSNQSAVVQGPSTCSASPRAVRFMRQRCSPERVENDCRRSRRMPAHMVAGAVANGLVFGWFRIAWVVVCAVFVYDLTVASGKFEVVKQSVGGISHDRRLQVLLIAFAFGAIL